MNIFQQIKQKFGKQIKLQLPFLGSNNVLSIRQQKVLLVQNLSLKPKHLKLYFNSIFVVRRAITDLSKAIITKSNIPELDSFATKIALHLMLFAHVIVVKTTKQILDPEFCEYWVTSNVDPKLVIVRYTTDYETIDYTYEELAVMTIDTIGYFNPVSVLESIAYELQSFDYSRKLMNSHFEKGYTARLAFILDSQGMNPTTIGEERQAITETVIGENNLGKPLVAFSDGAKGQIIELKNDFVSSEHIQFFEYITTSVATALGVPSDYVNQATKGSGLSDSRYKVTDYVYNQTIKALQKNVMEFLASLGVQYTLEEPLTEAQLLLAKNGIDKKDRNKV